jgi:hypothetical protein
LLARLFTWVCFDIFSVMFLGDAPRQPRGSQ